MAAVPAETPQTSRRARSARWLALVLALCLACVASLARFGSTALSLPAPLPPAAHSSSGGSQRGGRLPTAFKQPDSGDAALTAGSDAAGAPQQQPRHAAPAAAPSSRGGGSGKAAGVPAPSVFPKGALSDSQISADEAATRLSKSLNQAELAAAAVKSAAAELAAPALQAAERGAAGSVRLPIPRVALLFLTRGLMPLSKAWEEWLSGVDGLSPSYSLAAMGCSQGAVQRVREVGAVLASGGSSGQPLSLYRRQKLFSIYVHAPPEFTERYERGSVFYGRKMRQRVATAWGTHGLVVAVRAMLREALRDPLNQRFVLMSETDMPLWPAGLTYLQLMSEPASRVGACAPTTKRGVADSLPETADLLGFPRQHWRKSSQWITLSRAHASLVVADAKVEEMFARECYIKWDLRTWIERPGDRWCVSDEHYIPSLLAMLGEEGNCSCSRPGGRESPTHTEWMRGQPHPRVFGPGDFKLPVIQWARGCDAAATDQALRSYRALLPRTADWSQEACGAAAAEMGRLGVTLPGQPAAQQGQAAGGASLGSLLPQYQCRLALRKIDWEAGDALVAAMKGGLLDSQPLPAAAKKKTGLRRT